MHCALQECCLALAMASHPRLGAGQNQNMTFERTLSQLFFLAMSMICGLTRNMQSDPLVHKMKVANPPFKNCTQTSCNTVS
jgi:hypothetical protein